MRAESMRRLDVDSVVVVVRSVGLHTCYAQCVRRDTPLKDILKCQSCDGRVADCMQLVPTAAPGPTGSIQTVAAGMGAVFTIRIQGFASGISSALVLY